MNRLISLQISDSVYLERLITKATLGRLPDTADDQKQVTQETDIYCYSLWGN